MQVRDLINILRKMDTETLSASERELLSAFLTGLVPVEDMDLSSLLALLKPHRRRAPSATKGDAQKAPKAPVRDAGQIAASLRAVFTNDEKFEQSLKGLAQDRAVTVAILKQVFGDLFDREGGFRSRATRDDVLRKLQMERNVTIRDEKMGAMLGRKTVPAE